MDEGTGTIAYDSFGSNTGTLNTYITHIKTDQYSFQANLGRNIGNGTN